MWRILICYVGALTALIVLVPCFVHAFPVGLQRNPARRKLGRAFISDPEPKERAVTRREARCATSGIGSSFARVNLVSTDVGSPDCDLRDLVVGHLERVIFEHDEVGELTGDQ